MKIIPSIAHLLVTSHLFFSVVISKPNLGIKADFIDASGNVNEDKIISSYSSIIEFEEKGVPLDKSKMTDAKLVHLAHLAYLEMIEVWRSQHIHPAACPGAMAALAYEDKIFFASSYRIPKTAVVKYKDVHGEDVRNLMSSVTQHDAAVHQSGGACAEINIIDLVYEDNGQKRPDHGNNAPRLAAWVRPVADWNPDSNPGRNTAPCTYRARSGVGYGCNELMKNYGAEFVDEGAQPDSAGEDDWKFKYADSPRPPCKRD